MVVDGRELARRLAVRVSPTFLMVDREEVICWVAEGRVEPEELHRPLAACGADGKDR